MTKQVVNFSTKMIADIRNQMNADAIANNLPLPTDDEVELAVNKIFIQIKDKPYGNFALRDSGFWWVEGPLFGFGSNSSQSLVAIPRDPINITPNIPTGNLLLSGSGVSANYSGSPGKAPLQGNLILSGTSPTINQTTGSKFPLSGNVILSGTAPIVNLATGFIDDLAVTSFIDDVAETNFTADP